jgi:hypothetical protein
MTYDFLNLLFPLDHLSGDMDGKDAHGVCEILYRVMADPDFNLIPSWQKLHLSVYM